jgi:hypothetical protein
MRELYAHRAEKERTLFHIAGRFHAKKFLDKRSALVIKSARLLSSKLTIRPQAPNANENQSHLASKK